MTALDYGAWTLERYELAVHSLLHKKAAYFAIFLAVTFGTVFFLGYRSVPVAPVLDAARLLTISWFLPLPIMALALYAYFAWLKPTTLAIRHLAPVGPMKPLTVVFMVTAIGTQVETARHTLESTLYWLQEHPEMCFRPVVWLQMEERGYGPNKARYDALAARGVEIHIAPAGYETPNRTGFKARAQQHALDAVRARWPGAAERRHVWIYHQDEETAIGEDTILGIDQFVREHAVDAKVGFGTILYDQHFSARPSQIQELSRTDSDIRVMLSVVRPSNPLGGFHGSHYLMRADVESAIGWDFGPTCVVEDFAFELKARMQGVRFAVLPGFVHEQAALNVRDQLRQRRRWCQGFAETYWGGDLAFGATRRAVFTYSLIAWYAAIFSVPAMVFSLAFGFGYIVPVLGLLTGFVWFGMISSYHRSWVLHKPYVENPPPAWKMVLGGIAGSFVDGIAPWYALLTPHKRTFQVIRKDVAEVR